MILLFYSEFLKEKRIYFTKWTKQKCKEEALKYKSRSDFRKNNTNAYNASSRNGWLNDICSHMDYIKKSNYWTKEKCEEEALRYKTKSEFEKGSPSAYVKSGYMGWKDDICSHMTTGGNKYNRCIYAIEFPDKNVYIGLSYNYEKRFSQHLSDLKNNSIVLRHKNETGLAPKLIQLTDYIDVEDAIKMENIKLEEYKNNGWSILNIAKCGNAGGKTIKWTKEKCKEDALKYKSRSEFKKNSLAYRAAIRNKWIDDICDHMDKLHKNWDYESCKEEASKYKNKWEFKNKSSGAYAHAYKNKLLDEFFK